MVILDYHRPKICMRWYGIIQQLKLPRIGLTHALVDTTAEEDLTERIFMCHGILEDQISMLKYQFNSGLMNI